MSWYVSRDGRVSQPMPDAEFAACLRAGRLLDRDHVWTASLQGWMRVADFRRTQIAARLVQATDTVASQQPVPSVDAVPPRATNRTDGDRRLTEVGTADFVARLAAALDCAQNAAIQKGEPTPSQAAPATGKSAGSVAQERLPHEPEQAGTDDVRDVVPRATTGAIGTTGAVNAPAVSDLLSTWQSGWIRFYKGSHAQAAQAVGTLRASYVDPVAQALRTRLADVNLPMAELRGSVDQITTEGLTESVANLLDRSFQDLSVEDLMTENRLGNLADCTFDTLPTSARWTISLTLGREAYRSHVVRVLSSLRDYIDDDDLNSKPADVVRRYMRSGALRRRADAMTDQLRCEVKRQIEEDVIPALSQRDAGSAITS